MRSLIFWQGYKFQVICRGKQDSARSPIRFCLFDTFLSRRYKVPPDMSRADLLSAKHHKDRSFFCNNNRVDSSGENQHLSRRISDACKFLICGCGNTSILRAVGACMPSGPAWSIKINGPTMRCKRKGRMRFTFMPGANSAVRASITISSIRKMLMEVSIFLDFKFHL